MLNFDEWNKTNVVIVDEVNSKGQLIIRSRKSHCIHSDDMLISFETAFKYAKEYGWEFDSSEHLSSIKIYLELQKELNRPVKDYLFLSVMNWDSKEKLICPDSTNEKLAKQYNIANAILGYEDAYELLSDDVKSRMDSHKRFVENIVKRNQ